VASAQEAEFRAMFIDQANPKIHLPLGPEPCPDVVRQQVERICEASDFAHSERLKRFLRFIVDETLSGRGDRLKAYAIALSVFERDQSFDPQADPIVRIEAGRLRRALEHYYFTDGIHDPVSITVPKGCYVPQFAWRTVEIPVRLPEHVDADAADDADDPQPASAAFDLRARRHWAAALVAGLAVALLAGIAVSSGWRNTGAAPARPMILVVPFVSAGETSSAALMAAGLTGAMIDTLVGERGLRVMGRETTRWAQSDLSFSVLRKDYGLTHVLEGDVLAQNGRVTISARLVDAQTHAILWVSRYERGATTALADVEADIGAKVLATLGHPGEELSPSARGVDGLAAGQVAWDAYACKLRFYQYRADMTPENHAGVRQCLEATVGRMPKDAGAWGMLSLVLIDDLRGAAGDGGDRAATLARAKQAAATAVSLSPGDARALEADALALYFSGKPAEGRAAAEQAMAASPNDPEVLGEVGPRIAQAGEWDEGRRLLLQAIALNPANAGYYAGHLAFIAYMQGDIAAAADFIRRTNANQFATRSLVEAIIAAEMGDSDGAAAARDRFVAVVPGFMGRLDEEIASRNMTSADADRLRKGLAKAGF
jgi:adenylate cyclase